MSEKHIPTDMAEHNKVLELSRLDSERGLVILKMAYIDVRLGILLKARKELSLDGRIKLAKKRKILPPKILLNLNILRKIRNISAHEWDVDSLDHTSTKPLVESLVIDGSWIMPERKYSKAYVSNIMSYAVMSINDEIAKRKATSVGKKLPNQNQTRL